MVVVTISVIALSANAKKPKKVFKYNAIITNYSEISDKARQITFDFELSPYDQSWLRSFVVRNDLSERIYVEWENARVDNSRVVFGEDRRLMMNLQKADEAISPNSNSIVRHITGEKYIETNYIRPLFVSSYLKKHVGVKEHVYLKLPIRYMDNKIDEIFVEINIWYEEEAK